MKIIIIWNFLDKFQLNLSRVTVSESDDLTIESTKSIEILNKSVRIIDATTKTLEDPIYQNDLTTVSILYEEIPSIIVLQPEETEVEFTWVTIVQRSSNEIDEEFRRLHENCLNLLTIHTNEWRTFWAEKQVSAQGNDRLTDAIDASIFALASALPSLNTSQPRARYFGLSPAGLGLDRKLEVYNGHSFWDTEIWIFPVPLLLQPEWSKELLNYRYFMRKTAYDNAVNTHYKGYR